MVGGSSAVTIANGYSAFPDTCHFLTPGDPMWGSFPTYPLVKSYWGNIGSDGNPSGSVIVQVNPTYRFDGTTYILGFNQTNIFVPSRVTFPFGYCTTSSYNYNVFNQFPYLVPTSSGCNRPTFLLYGFEDIPATPVDTTIGQSAQVNGEAVSRLDGGFPSQFRGAITWFRPPTCTNPDISFQALFNITGLFDLFDLSPVRYIDSASGMVKTCPVAGIRCAGAPRAVVSQIYDAQPNIRPICRSVMPFDPTFTPAQLAEYYHLFGTNYRGPVNVPVNGIEYSFRTDNLFPPVAVKMLMPLNYIGGSVPVDTTIGLSVGGFNIIQSEILFKASLGTNPALVSGRFYNFVSTPVYLYNEADMGFLPPCNCGTNIPCDITFNVPGEHPPTTDPNDPNPTGVNKNAVPAYNDAIRLIPPPTCDFIINNGQQVYAGIPFLVTSLAGGGIPPLSFDWRLIHIPPAGGFIAMPNTNDIVSVTINSLTDPMGLPFAITHTVSNLHGLPVSCSQNFTVLGTAPIASLVPADVTIQIGNTITLDGSGTFTPAGGPPPIFEWTIPFNPGGNGIITRNLARPVVDFTASAVGTYIVTMKVRNAVSSTNANSVIRVVPIVTPVTPSLPPLVPPSGNFTCFTPIPPVNYTIPSGPSPPPLSPSPAVPSAPVFTPSAPGLSPSMVPFAMLPAITPFNRMLLLLILIFTITVLVCSGFISFFYGSRRRRGLARR